MNVLTGTEHEIWGQDDQATFRPKYPGQLRLAGGSVQYCTVPRVHVVHER